MKWFKKIMLELPLFGYSTNKKTKDKAFAGSKNYWQQRYQEGGNSGNGSYNILAEFKANILNSFVKEQNIKSVIEFGSGDGNQIKYFNFQSYLGLDVSATAITRCRKIYALDQSKKFKSIQNYNKESADLTISLDVIYHLIEDDVYFGYMKKLFSASNRYVIIYSSNTNEHPRKVTPPHIRHRVFTKWVDKNVPEYKLVEFIPNRFPFNGNNKVSSFSDFYIYDKYPIES